jgi:hypothetical protein
MPWGVVSLMSLRQEFVRLSEKKAVSFTELCQRYGISRKTGTNGWVDTVNKEAKVCSIIRVVPRTVPGNCRRQKSEL